MRWRISKLLAAAALPPAFSPKVWKFVQAPHRFQDRTQIGAGAIRRKDGHRARFHPASPDVKAPRSGPDRETS